MKIQITGFKCDVCENEHLEEPENNWSYNLTITSNMGGLHGVGKANEYKHVCEQCTSRILEFINYLYKSKKEYLTEHEANLLIRLISEQYISQ